MKKQELKNDPIRDYIVNAYNYLNEHKSLTSSFDYAGPMTETVLMGNIAIRSYMERKEGEKTAKRKEEQTDGCVSGSQNGRLVA